MKLTSEQIEAIRKAAPELADKLEAGEAVTVERDARRWEPEYGSWYATTDGKVIRQMSSPPVMAEYTRNGVQRKSKEAAERLAHDQRIFNRLHAYREEFAPGYVVPDYPQYAFYPMLDTKGFWGKRADGVLRSPTAVYMPDELADELCRKLNSGEVVL